MDDTQQQRQAQFQRIEEVFHRAVDLDPDARSNLLAAECADDPELRRRVEDLLAASGDAEEEIEGAVRSAFGRLEEEPTAFGVPKRIGPYRVIRELGRGGFSTVYLAQRDDDQFQMTVAIKVVRQATDDVVRRLRRERQILANFDHPNIARIVDGGSFSPFGGAGHVPYVVMEYIDGEPIDVFCQDLPLERRLELFRSVCDAVQYAHGNLVLHRDIKPSNILVNADGMPKLLDFGIAKVLVADPDTEGTATATTPTADLMSTLTRPGVRVLTPEYASPEQIAGRPLTTATDVYSLGVLLYLVISGKHPYRFDKQVDGGLAWSEIERMILEAVPEPPSARGSHPRWRSPDDLDTVVLQALRKQPERRYASVEQLSEDVRCYLAALPVSARPETFGYLLRRFVVRHRVPVAAALLIFLTLLTAVFVTAWQAREAREQRQLAERQRTRAERVAGFLESLFEDASPYQSQESNLSARQILERGALRLRSDRAGDPELQSTLAATLGRVHREMNLFDEAEDLLEMALELRQSLGDEPGQTAEIQRDLGILFTETSDCPRALEMLGTALEAQSKSETDFLARARTLHELGAARILCDVESAAEPLEQALVIRRQLLGDDSVEVADTESRLAELSFHRREYERAQQLLQQVLEKRRRIQGPNHPAVGSTLNDLAAVAYSHGDYAGAVPLYEQALAVYRRSFGELHGQVGQTLYNLGLATAYLHGTSELTEEQKRPAERLFREAIGVAREVFGSPSPLEADCLHELGQLYWRIADYATAEELYSQALEAIRGSLGEDHPYVLRTHLALAKAIAHREPARGEAAYRESVELYRRLLPADDFQQSAPLLRLGRLLLDRGDARAAEPVLQRVIEIRRQSLPPNHWRTADAERYLGQSLADLGRLEEAERAYRSSYRSFLASFGEEHRLTRLALQRLEDLERRREQ